MKKIHFAAGLILLTGLLYSPIMENTQLGSYNQIDTVSAATGSSKPKPTPKPSTSTPTHHSSTPTPAVVTPPVVIPPVVTPPVVVPPVVVTPASPTKTVLTFTVGQKKYALDGKVLVSDSPIISKDGRILLPLRLAAKSLGADVQWDKAKKEIILTKGQNVIALWLDKNTALVNGIEKSIDSKNPQMKPLMVNGRILVPAAFMANSFGSSISWAPATHSITLSWLKIESAETVAVTPAVETVPVPEITPVVNSSSSSSSSNSSSVSNDSSYSDDEVESDYDD